MKTHRTEYQLSSGSCVMLSILLDQGPRSRFPHRLRRSVFAKGVLPCTRTGGGLTTGRVDGFRAPREWARGSRHVLQARATGHERRLGRIGHRKVVTSADSPHHNTPRGGKPFEGIKPDRFTGGLAAPPPLPGRVPCGVRFPRADLRIARSTHLAVSVGSRKAAISGCLRLP